MFNNSIQWWLENWTRKSEQHLKSEPLEVRFSNGRKFGFRMVRTIQKPNTKWPTNQKLNAIRTERLWTIWIPNLFGTQAPTVYSNDPNTQNTKKCKQTTQHVLQIKQKKVFILVVVQQQKSWKLVQNLHNTLEQLIGGFYIRSFLEKHFLYVSSFLNTFGINEWTINLL